MNAITLWLTGKPTRRVTIRALFKRTIWGVVSTECSLTLLVSVLAQGKGSP